MLLTSKSKHLVFAVIVINICLKTSCWTQGWDAHCHIQDLKYDGMGQWLHMEIRRSHYPPPQDVSTEEGSEENQVSFRVQISCRPNTCTGSEGRRSFLVFANQIESIFLGYNYPTSETIEIAWWMDSALSAKTFLHTTKRRECGVVGRSSSQLSSIPVCCRQPPRIHALKKETADEQRLSCLSVTSGSGSPQESEDSLGGNSCWKLIFRQTERSAPVRYDQWRSVTNTEEHVDDHISKTFSILDELERFRSPHDEKFTFAMSWGALGQGDHGHDVNIWRQKSNPISSHLVEGYEDIDVKWTSLGFGGLPCHVP